MSWMVLGVIELVVLSCFPGCIVYFLSLLALCTVEGLVGHIVVPSIRPSSSLVLLRCLPPWDLKLGWDSTVRLGVDGR